MKALKKVWGLLVDDGRLAVTLVVSLAVAFVLTLAGWRLTSAIVIAAGLVVALWVSVMHQLKLVLKRQ